MSAAGLERALKDVVLAKLFGMERGCTRVQYLWLFWQAGTFGRRSLNYRNPVDCVSDACRGWSDWLEIFCCRWVGVLEVQKRWWKDAWWGVLAMRPVQKQSQLHVYGRCDSCKLHCHTT